MGQAPKLFNNASLKIISLIIAAFLWFFVTNYQDPETVLTINNVPVKLLHSDMIESEGKVCIVLDDSDTIPVVTVNAPRSVVDSLSSENIVATADVDEMDSDYKVPIVLTTNKYSDSITSISGSIDYVSLSVEDKETATMTIDAGVTGTVAEGFQIGQISLDQNQVRVTGPASEVGMVKSAGVSVDVTNTDRSISTNADIHLYDEDGVDLDIDKNLTLNIDKVLVTVEVLAVKEIPVKIAVTGTPADGYRLTGETSVEPGRIKVAGKKSLIDAVDSVSIPSSELNVTGRNKDLVKTIDITDYLGNGVELAEGEQSAVKVTIEIIPIEGEQNTAE